jgi:hypothetical protein
MYIHPQPNPTTIFSFRDNPFFPFIPSLIDSFPLETKEIKEDEQEEEHKNKTD